MPTEPGWGLSIVQHGTGTIFAVFFLYDPDREAAWYVVPSGEWTSETRYEGTLYRTAGPLVSGTFDPASVTVAPVGTASFDFLAGDADRATVTVAMEGRTIVKAIQRQVFR